MDDHISAEYLPTSARHLGVRTLGPKPNFASPQLGTFRVARTRGVLMRLTLIQLICTDSLELSCVKDKALQACCKIKFRAGGPPGLVGRRASRPRVSSLLVRSHHPRFCAVSRTREFRNPKALRTASRLLAVTVAAA